MSLALNAAAPLSVSDQRLSRNAALYEEICLKAFPDDKAVEAIMIAQHAREFTPNEVRVTMRADPARGWELQDGSASIWIEYPPYHACSVRWNAPQMSKFDAYRAVADKYEHSTGGFSPVNPYDDDQGDIHIHAVGEQRALPDKSSESLFVFDQQINDPKRRAAGETGVVLRFVHQYALPLPSDAK
jgi:hypothetical protein